MDVVYDFYGNRSTFEHEFEYEYEYVAVFMDIEIWHDYFFIFFTHYVQVVTS